VKKNYFSSFRFSIRFRLLLKRGAKVRRFFRLSQGRSKVYFRGLWRSGTGCNTSTASVQFLTFQFFCKAVAVAKSDARLAIGSAKVEEFSGAARGGAQLLWGAGVAEAILGRRRV
jgi:hypothetical protein